jgi:F0F1-type ATP synthase membrane subunit c/vacuolar-type H+-ATPase subunit K
VNSNCLSISVAALAAVLCIGQLSRPSAQSSLTDTTQNLTPAPATNTEAAGLTSDSISILTKQYEESVKLEHSGKRLRIGGGIMLFAGTPIFIIGGAMIAASSVKDTVEENMFGPGTYKTTTPNRTGQAIGMTIGVAGGVTCIIVGVVQRTIGKIILAKAQEQKRLIEPKLKVTGNSVSLILNF